MSTSILQSRFLIFSLLLTAGVITVMFVQLPCNSLLCREIQNSGHVILFALMTQALMAMMRNSCIATARHWLIDFAIAGGVMVALAVLTELGQLITQREPSLSDVLRDCAGVAVGLGLYAFFDPSVLSMKQPGRLLITSLLLAALCLLAICFYPVMNIALASWQRDQAFPVIADFGARWTHSFVQLNQASLMPAIAATGFTATESGAQRRVAQLTLNPGAYPGISIVEPYPDWSGYQTLSLDLYSPHARPINLVLRIDDERHDQAYADRFNRSLTLRPGHNRIQIPLREIAEAPARRAMDMKRIASLMLFAVDVDEVIRLYPAMIRLE